MASTNHEFVIRNRIMQSTTKEGVIPQNPDGTYTVCVGSLDQVSVADKLYYSSYGAEKFFQSQGQLTDALEKNYLFGECGHPEFAPGMTAEQYLQRNLIINEKHISHIIVAIRMIPNQKDPETGEVVTLLMADIKPAGVYGAALERDLKTPGVNVSFSIRCLTKGKFINGRNARVLSRVITFDWVSRPGMPPANKLMSLTCQSFNGGPAVGLLDYDDATVVKLHRTMSNPNSSLSLQSSGVGKGVVDALFQDIVRTKGKSTANAYNW